MSTRYSVYYENVPDGGNGVHIFRDLIEQDTERLFLEYSERSFTVLIRLPKDLSEAIIKAFEK